MTNKEKEKKPLSHLIPVAAIEDFNSAIAETGCRSRDATEAAVRLWVSLTKEQRALLNVRVVCGKSVTFDDIYSDVAGDGPVAEVVAEVLKESQAVSKARKKKTRRRS